MSLKNALLCSLIAATAVGAVGACGSDSTKDEAEKARNPNAVSPDEYRKRQQAFADSVLNNAAPASKLVEKLGKGYAVGSVALRDTIGALARASNCYQQGRDKDPYLAGTVSVFAHMAVIGVDLIQVQDKNWTSAAGDLVDACLNSAMKNWKLDMTFGRPAAYIVQVQFTMDSLSIPRPDTATTIRKKPVKPLSKHPPKQS